MKKVIVLAAAVVAGSAGLASAATIAQWTFETSIPTTAGPFSPETGAGSASGSHVGATVYSSPSGNGSSHSYSSTLWAVGDYYQFQVATTGYKDLSVTFDQGSSNTGPRDFVLQYSTNGTSFSQFGSAYTVLANAAPNPTWTPTTPQSIYTLSFDLSSVTALNDTSAVYFRLADNSTVSANGGAVGTGGTDRLDNFTVAGTSVPEPAATALLGLSGLMALRRRRRA